MRKTTWGLAALCGLMALALAADAQQGPAGGKKPLAFKERVAKEAKMKVADVEKVLKALGPAAREHLRAGQTIDELPGVGTLRVVRVEEHKDLVKGIPAIIPARNFVEFVPAAELTTAANAPGAVPAKTVPPYEFRVNPAHTPSTRAEPLKTNRTRAGR